MKLLLDKEIQTLYRKEVEIRLRSTSGEKCERGWYFKDTREMHIYVLSHSSMEDLYITLFHECIHARNDLFSRRDCEPNVERESCATYAKQPELVQIIMALWNLKRRRNWPRNGFPAQLPMRKTHYNISIAYAARK